MPTPVLNKVRGLGSDPGMEAMVNEIQSLHHQVAQTTGATAPSRAQLVEQFVGPGFVQPPGFTPLHPRDADIP